jgi:integrase/recombinase XerD
MARKGQRKRWPFLDPCDPQGMPVLLSAWAEALRLKGLAESYVEQCVTSISRFIVFCQERSVTKARDVTKPVIERYQRHLFHLVKEGKEDEGELLSLKTQHQRLLAIKLFFRWLARNDYVLSNPASEIELPRLPPTRPPEILSPSEVDRVLAAPDLDTHVGVRDRAILETLYSTGMRRGELSRLKVSDLDHEAGLVRIRHGKGKKERLIPIGSRALAWIHRYFLDARPALVAGPDDGTLFLTVAGRPFWPDNLTNLARRYVKKAGIKKPGSCHVFRHTMATRMLENGADIRFIQEMLGHASLDATQIYTHVSVRKLKEIHTATHPAATLEPRRREGEDDELPLLAAEPVRNHGEEDENGKSGAQ